MIRENLSKSSLYAMAMVTSANGVGYQYIDSLGPGTPIVLFADGFVDSTPNNNFPNWSSAPADPPYSSSSMYPEEDGGDPRSAKFDNDEALYTEISTVGYDSITVKYARRSTFGVGDSSYFYAEWFDGTAWQLLETFAGPLEWELTEFALPISANDNPDFVIRFRVESVDSDKAYVDMLEVTSTPIVSSGSASAANGLSSPYWIKIKRTGDTFTFYDSPDGTSWTQSGAAVIPMTADTYIGMAVTAHQVGELCTGEFDNVFYGLRADINENGVVNIDDLQFLTDFWLQECSMADIAPVSVDGTVFCGESDRRGKLFMGG